MNETALTDIDSAMAINLDDGDDDDNDDDYIIMTNEETVPGGDTASNSTPKNRPSTVPSPHNTQPIAMPEVEDLPTLVNDSQPPRVQSSPSQTVTVTTSAAPVPVMLASQLNGNLLYVPVNTPDGVRPTMPQPVPNFRVHKPTLVTTTPSPVIVVTSSLQQFTPTHTQTQAVLSQPSSTVFQQSIQPGAEKQLFIVGAGQPRAVTQLSAPIPHNLIRAAPTTIPIAIQQQPTALTFSRQPNVSQAPRIPNLTIRPHGAVAQTALQMVFAKFSNEPMSVSQITNPVVTVSQQPAPVLLPQGSRPVMTSQLLAPMHSQQGLNLLPPVTCSTNVSAMTQHNTPVSLAQLQLQKLLQQVPPRMHSGIMIPGSGSATGQTPTNTGMQIPGSDVVQAPTNILIEAPGSGAIQGLSNVFLQAPGNATVQAPRNTFLQTPRYAAVQAPRSIVNQAPNSIQALGVTRAQAPRYAENVQAPRSIVSQAPNSAQALGATRAQAPRSIIIQNQSGADARPMFLGSATFQAPTNVGTPALGNMNIAHPRMAVSPQVPNTTTATRVQKTVQTVQHQSSLTSVLSNMSSVLHNLSFPSPPGRQSEVPGSFQSTTVPGSLQSTPALVASVQSNMMSRSSQSGLEGGSSNAAPVEIIDSDAEEGPVAGTETVGQAETIENAESVEHTKTAGQAETARHSEIAGCTETARHSETAGCTKNARHSETAERTKSARHSETAGRTKTARHSETAGHTKSARHSETAGHTKTAKHSETAGRTKTTDPITIDSDVLDECLMCGGTFVTKRQFTSHMNVHKGSKMACFICEKPYSSTIGLKLHFNKMHGKLYRCRACFASLRGEVALENHANECLGSQVAGQDQVESTHNSVRGNKNQSKDVRMQDLINNIGTSIVPEMDKATVNGPLVVAPSVTGLFDTDTGRSNSQTGGEKPSTVPPPSGGFSDDDLDDNNEALQSRISDIVNKMERKNVSEKNKAKHVTSPAKTTDQILLANPFALFGNPAVDEAGSKCTLQITSVCSLSDSQDHRLPILQSPTIKKEPNLQAPVVKMEKEVQPSITGKRPATPTKAAIKTEISSLESVTQQPPGASTSPHTTGGLGKSRALGNELQQSSIFPTATRGTAQSSSMDTGQETNIKVRSQLDIVVGGGGGKKDFSPNSGEGLPK